ncbi:MAG TPA: hypothetical protein VFK90_14190 [Anaeromyxobacter sp.]|nr:hypothetical protein [Anaeromyxobacter sp.]
MARRPGEGDRANRDAVDVNAHMRPGVPLDRPETFDPFAHRAPPARQREGVPPPGPGAVRDVAMRDVPVYGAAQPLHGVSGVLRRAAYRLPERGTARWLLLLAGDRVDVLEHRAASGLWVIPAAAGLALGYAAVARALARR